MVFFSRNWNEHFSLNYYQNRHAAAEIIIQNKEITSKLFLHQYCCFKGVAKGLINLIINKCLIKKIYQDGYYK